MFVWMPHSTISLMPRPVSHACRSTSPWNAELTCLPNSRAGRIPSRIGCRSLPGWPGRSGDAGSTESWRTTTIGSCACCQAAVSATMLSSAAGLLRGPHFGVGEALLDVDHDQCGCHAIRMAPVGRSNQWRNSRHAVLFCHAHRGAAHPARDARVRRGSRRRGLGRRPNRLSDRPVRGSRLRAAADGHPAGPLGSDRADAHACADCPRAIW